MYRNTSLRETDISIFEIEREVVPNNLTAECKLSVFDKRAVKASMPRNFKFSGKSIRNDMMLYKINHEIVDKSSKIISKLLDNREKEWDTKQK